jgi:hypothetical protein
MTTIIDAREAVAIVTNARTLLGGAVEGGHAIVPALAFCDRLGTLLWRAKYGADRRVLPAAALLLANIIRTAHRFKRAPGAQRRRGRTGRRNDAAASRQREHTPADLADALARRAITEWVDDRCEHCDGRGMMGGEQYLGSRVLARCKACAAEGWIVDVLRAPSSAPVVDDFGNLLPLRKTCGTCGGRGRVDRAQPPAGPATVCSHCKGTGKRRVDHARRAAAIGLPLDVYRRQWAPVFDALLSLLDQVDAKVAAGLRSQLRRDNVPAKSTGPQSDRPTDLSPLVGSPGRPAKVEQDPPATSQGEPVQTQSDALARL